MAITNSVDVAVGQRAAWAKLADLDNAGDWNTVHTDYPDGDPGPAEAGKRFREKVSLMGMPAEIEWTIDTAEEPHTLVMRGSGPMGTALTATFTVAAVDGAGSRITYTSEFTGGAAAAMQGPAEAALKRAGDASLARLAEQLG